MKKNILIAVLFLTTPCSLFAQSKVDKRLANSATALQAILEGDNGLPNSVLNQAVCVLIYPSVKKVALGIGDSYGRGELICRKGAKMNGTWSAPAEKANAVQWVKSLRDNLQPFAHGVYVNQLGETSDELVRAAYGPNHARLVEIKKKYDPKNVLRLNQNIKPDTPSNS